VRLGRRGTASVVAFLVAVLLLSSMSASIMLLSEEYRRMASSSKEPIEEISEALKEHVKIIILDINDDSVTLQARNFGEISVVISEIVLKAANGSLLSFPLSEPVKVPAGGTVTFSADIDGEAFTHLGAVSSRGTLFSASLSSVTFVQTGLTDGMEWSITLGGETKSKTGRYITFEDVESGTHEWSASSPPAENGMRYIASPSKGTITVPDQTVIDIKYTTQYYLNIVASPDEGGTVSPSGGWYDEGTIASIKATSEPGYRFDGWIGSGNGSYSGTEEAPTIHIYGPINQTAVFVKQSAVTFSISEPEIEAGGTILAIDGKNYRFSDLPVSFTWDVGSQHTFEWTEHVATGSDKRYVWISTSGLSRSRSGTIIVPDGGGSIIASYKTQYTLTIGASEGGTTNPAPGTYWYDAGSSVDVAAVPNTGFVLDHWELDGKDAGSENPYRVSMNDEHTLEAFFALDRFSLTIRVLEQGGTTGIQGVTVKIDGSPYKTDINGEVKITASYGTHRIEIISPYSPSSGIRFVFTRWGDGKTSNPRLFSVTNPSTFTAYMKKQYYLTMSAGVGGSVFPSSGWYDAGAQMQIKATAKSGYRFDKWTGSGSGSYSGTKNPANIRLNAPITETASFIKIETVTFSASGLGLDSYGTILVVDGAKYGYSDLPVTFVWDAGTSHSFEWKTPVPASTTKRYVWTETSGLSTSREGSIMISSSGSVTALYKTQYSVTLRTSGLGGDFSGNSVTFDGKGHRVYDGHSVRVWIDSGERVSYTWHSPITSTTSGKRYVITSSSSGSIKVNSAKIVSATYKTQYSVTLKTIGLGSDFSGDSVTFNEKNYRVYDENPVTIWIDSGTPINYNWASTIYSTTSGKRYRFTDATETGINTKTITASYEAQYQWTFSQQGVGSDAKDPVIKIDGTNYYQDSLPKSFWWNEGSKHSYQYYGYVYSSIDGKRFAVHSPPSTTITVSSSGSESASYHVEYRLIIQSTSGGTTRPKPGTYWHDSGSKVDVTANPNSGYRFDHWTLDGKDAGSKNPQKVTMNSAHTIKAHFVKNSYTVTFSAKGLKNDVTGTILEVDGVKYVENDLPIQFTWTVGSTHNFEWKSPASASSSKCYVWTSTSGLSTSRKDTITVPTGGGKVEASYKTRYMLKLSIELSPANAEGYGISTNPAPGEYWYDVGAKVKITAVNNAPYEVTLQADTTASDITTSVNPTSGTEFTSTLTVKVGSGVAAGTYKIQVTGFEYGWEFEKWVLDGKNSGTGNSITVTMNRPHTLEAHFWMPQAEVTLSESQITLNKGESGSVTVNVRKTTASNKNTAYLSVVVPPRVTLNVKDYRGKPLSGVTVSVGEQFKRTDSNGRAVFSVQPGRYQIAVPSTVGAGVYCRAFFKWSEGKTGNTRTENINGDASFTAIYNAIAFFGEFTASEIPPSVSPGPITSPSFAASGVVYYGDPQPLAGVKVKVVFHLISWLFGRKVVSVTATTDSNGEFYAKYDSLADALAYDLEYAEAYVVSSGYQSETVTYGSRQTFYAVTFVQEGLPAGTEWKVNLAGHEKSSTNNYITFYAPNGRYSYTVESPIYHGVSRYVASPSHGTVTVNGLAEDIPVKFTREYSLLIQVSGGGTTSPSAGTYWYPEGTKVTIKATASPGYRFSKWEGSGSGSYTGSKATATITMNDPIVETAIFVKTAKVTFSASGLGSDALGTVLIVDGKSYKRANLPKTFTWDAGSKHSFSWTSLVGAGSDKRYVWTSTSGLSKKRSATITVPDNGGSITAYYKTQYALTVSASPSGSGTTSPSGTRWYDEGSRVTVSASPSSEFKVSLSASGLPRDVSSSFNPSSGAPSFASTFKISASSSASPGSYTITVKGTKSGYNFYCWKLDGSRVSSSKSYSLYMYAPHTLTAVFTQPKIKVDVQSSLVNVEPGKYASVSVKVSTSSSEDASDTFTLKVLKYVTVTIKVQDYHRGKAISRVSVSVDGQSKKTDSQGKASFTVLEGSHTVSVPSLAGAGSRGTLPFLKWSDGSTSRSRSITVSGDKTYAAIYKNILYYSSVNAGKTGSTKFWAEAYVRVKGYSGSAAYASRADVKATWEIWYWYRWWPDYVTKSGVGDSSGYKYLSTTINAWGVTGIKCKIEASKSGYKSVSWEKTVYSTSYADVTFSVSGLDSASGTVLKVDGASYKLSDLPRTFTWQIGSSHSFEWTSPISISSKARYAWKSTSGITTKRSGTLTVPDGGGNVKATYGKQYYLTMNAGTGGSVSPSSGWRDANSKVTISATSNTGYKFDRWIGSGSGSYTGYSSKAIITMKAPITETAYFKEDSYTVKFTCSGKPSGKKWYVTFNGETKGRYGSTIYFYNVKAGSYSFTVDVIYDGSGTRYNPSPSSGTINVPSTTSKSITFTKQYKLKMSRNIAGGYISPSLGEHWYSAGTSVTIKAYAYSDYKFKKWSGSGSGSYTGYSSSATITMNGPITQTAYFEETSRTYTVTFYCSGKPSGKSWSVKFNGVKKSTTRSYIKFYDVEPGSHYYYVYTIYSGTGTRYKPSPSSGFLKVPDSTSKTITFTKQYRLHMKRSPTSGGTTKPTPGYHWYKSGSRVTINASPYSGYKFKKWVGSGTGSYSGTSRTKTITMKGAITETAYFEKTGGGGSTIYTVKFRRTGVPSGASWWAKLGSKKKTSSSSTVTFTGVKKGTYSWSVKDMIYHGGVWYIATGSTSGTMTVDRNRTKTIRYIPVY